MRNALYKATHLLLAIMISVDIMQYVVRI